MNPVAGAGGIALGPVHIAPSVLTTWAIMGLLVVSAFLATRRLRGQPSRVQTALEGIVSLMEAGVREVLPDQVRTVLPFVGTLWLFVVVANLAGVVPGVSSPTSDLSVTSALAFLVFCSVHWFGIRHVGWKAYLRHYLS
ncbi:MAG TPA: F0F1 ATP synthase subunit A, partial [bacterium]|nr:F0F1 ATP synthase subunit A [bacterium]